MAAEPHQTTPVRCSLMLSVLTSPSARPCRREDAACGLVRKKGHKIATATSSLLTLPLRCPPHRRAVLEQWGGESSPKTRSPCNTNGPFHNQASPKHRWRATRLVPGSTPRGTACRPHASQTSPTTSWRTSRQPRSEPLRPLLEHRRFRTLPKKRSRPLAAEPLCFSRLRRHCTLPVVPSTALPRQLSPSTQNSQPGGGISGGCGSRTGEQSRLFFVQQPEYGLCWRNTAQNPTPPPPKITAEDRHARARLISHATPLHTTPFMMGSHSTYAHPEDHIWNCKAW